MKQGEQFRLFKNDQELFYGGSLVQGKRKIERTLCSKRPIHLVLKARKRILFKNKKEITRLVQKYAKRFYIKIYEMSVQHDHLHVVIRIFGRKNYVSFIRTLSGQMARKFGKNLFKFLPFTRIVAWGRDYKQTKVYLQKNEREVFGLQAYTPRKDYYGKYRQEYRQKC